MEETPKPESSQTFQPDAETLADAESLEYKHITTIDPAHKVQTGAGMIAGAVAGAGIGTLVAGPIGALVGAGVGAISGAAGGKIAGEMFDPSAEFEYWQTHHAGQPWVDPKHEYTDYEPAYRVGYDNYAPGVSFEQAEKDVEREYNQRGGQHRLPWEEARLAAKAAWERMSYIFPPEKMNRF